MPTFNTNLQQRAPEFEIYSVETESELVTVLIMEETGNITVTPYYPKPRGHFNLRDWIFDNTRRDLKSVATIAGLAVLLGEPR